MVHWLLEHDVYLTTNHSETLDKAVTSFFQKTKNKNCGIWIRLPLLNIFNKILFFFLESKHGFVSVEYFLNGTTNIFIIWFMYTKLLQKLNELLNYYLRRKFQGLHFMSHSDFQSLMSEYNSMYFYLYVTRIYFTCPAFG